MGSGAFGSYGSSNGSQPYAPSYHVVKSMHEQDIINGTYHNGHYSKNPTAKSFNEMINGNYIGNKNMNIDMPYVIDLDGNIIVGRRNGNGPNGIPTPHPTLIGGKDPQVKMAGIVHIQGGKIASYDGRSGHYKPNAKSMEAADEAFGKLPAILFKRKGKR
ncbi:MAG: hypothetical protein J5855_02460 [Mailhella sp.]|nr:hypothetical protein [Mailhella sp.]